MKDAIEQRLAQLEPPARGGQTRVIRERYDAIESALARGVTRQQIVELLAEEGVTVSLPFFKNILHRVRQEKKRPSQSSAAASHATPPLVTAKPPSRTPEPTKIDTWQRLDEIRNSTPDLQALRKQHLLRIKGNQE